MGRSEIDDSVGRRQRSVVSTVLCHIVSATATCGCRMELAYVPGGCPHMDCPRLPQDHPHLHTRLKARQCRRQDRIVVGCAARCTCYTQRVQCAMHCQSVPRRRKGKRRTFLYGRGSVRKSGSLARAYWDLRFRSCLRVAKGESASSRSAASVS